MDKQNPLPLNQTVTTVAPLETTEPQTVQPSDAPCFEPKYILTGFIVLIILGVASYFALRIFPVQNWITSFLRLL